MLQCIVNGLLLNDFGFIFDYNARAVYIIIIFGKNCILEPSINAVTPSVRFTSVRFAASISSGQHVAVSLEYKS